MNIRYVSWLGCALTAAVASVACSAQVNPQYQGEPLATVRGSIVTSDSRAPQVDAAVLWMTATQKNVYTALPKMLATRVSVGSTFPANFSLDLLTPPPAEAEVLEAVPQPDGSVSSDGPFRSTGLWLGLVVAVAPGTGDGAVRADDVLGVDLDHVIVYFDRVPAAAGASGGFVTKQNLADTYHVPATVGYHLAKTERSTPEETHTALQCVFNGLCRHQIGDADGDQQSLDDWSYQRCLEEVPGAPTCTLSWSPKSPEEAAEDARCKTLVAALPEKSDCTIATTRPENPAGFDDPATVTLGKSIWELSLFGNWFGVETF